jgi:SAM-dependent methyltransferase
MTAVDEVLQTPFDRPALWRAEIIHEMGLAGDDRCAAASPAPGFPVLVESVLGEMRLRPGRWLDVGGGLGGAAAWISETTAGAVTPVLLDPAIGSIEAARRLFPSIPSSVADGERLPVRDGCIDGVFVNGVISLHRDVRSMLSDVRRSLRHDGRLAITDIWSNQPGSFDESPNRFWSLGDIADVLSVVDLEVVHVAVADLSAGWWSDLAVRVDEEIYRRHAEDDGFDEWHRDREHLQRTADSGRLMAAGLVAAPSCAGGFVRSAAGTIDR